jgi:hypothetical protein
VTPQRYFFLLLLAGLTTAVDDVIAVRPKLLWLKPWKNFILFCVEVPVWGSEIFQLDLSEGWILF